MALLFYQLTFRPDNKIFKKYRDRVDRAKVEFKVSYLTTRHQVERPNNLIDRLSS